MPSYNTILVALDLNPDSVNIFSRAMRLCEGDWSRLHLIHVAEHPVTGLGTSTGKNHRRGEQQVRQEVYPQLQQLSADAPLPPDHFHIVFGDPATEVTELAMKLAVDLIVVGSHGKTGLKRLLGSNSESVIQRARCDVLMVRI